MRRKARSVGKRAKTVGDLSEIFGFMVRLGGAGLHELAARDVQRILKGTREFVVIKGDEQEIGMARKWMRKYRRALVLVEAEEEHAGEIGKRCIDKYFHSFKEVAYQVVPIKRKGAGTCVYAMLIKRRRVDAQEKGRRDRTGIDEMLLQLLPVTGCEDN